MSIIFVDNISTTPVGAATNKDFVLVLAPTGAGAKTWVAKEVVVTNQATSVTGTGNLLGSDGTGVDFINSLAAEWPDNYFAVAAYKSDSTEAEIKAQMEALATHEGRQGSTPSRFAIASDLSARALPNSSNTSTASNTYVTKLHELCSTENMIGYVTTGQNTQANDVAWGDNNSSAEIFPIANVGSIANFGRVVGSLVQQADAVGFGHGVSQHHLHASVATNYPLSLRSGGVATLHAAHVNPVVNGVNPNDSILAGGEMNIGAANTVDKYYEALQQIQLVKRTLTIYGQAYIDSIYNAATISQALSNDVAFLVGPDVGSLSIDPHAGGQTAPNRRLFDLRIGCYVGASVLEFVVTPFAL